MNSLIRNKTINQSSVSSKFKTGSIMAKTNKNEKSIKQIEREATKLINKY